MDQTELTNLLADAAARAGHYRSDETQRVWPDEAALAGLDGLTSVLPENGRPSARILADLDELGSPATARATGGRYYGFVNGGTTDAGLAASILTAAWDQNVALPVMSPVSAHLDTIAARWVVQLLGLPADAIATFCGGASIANLTAILAGRDELLRRQGWSVSQAGMAGSPPLRVVATGEMHVSVVKALRAAGIGLNAIEMIPTDSYGAADPDGVPDLDDRTIVVLQAGNVNTGHSDPFHRIIPQAREAGAWVHIDGAFGLWAAASRSRRHLVGGAELADSWATDAHKWLNAPYDSGIVIVSDEAALRRATSVDAAYLQTDDDRTLMNLGLQMSQRSRGVEAWAVMAGLGRAGVESLVDDLSDLAVRFAERLVAAGASLLAPVVLNQALVAFDDDDTTSRVVAAVQDDGRCWAGGTTWQGRTAMRLSVSSHTTTEYDIDASADAIIECWTGLR